MLFSKGFVNFVTRLIKFKQVTYISASLTNTFQESFLCGICSRGKPIEIPPPQKKKTQFHPALCFASKITQLPPACLRSTSGDSSEPRRSAGKFCSTFRPAEARIIFAIAPIQLFQLQVIIPQQRASEYGFYASKIRMFSAVIVHNLILCLDAREAECGFNI